MWINEYSLSDTDSYIINICGIYNVDFFSHIYLARVAKLMTKSFWPLCISLACNKEMTGNRKISRKD